MTRDVLKQFDPRSSWPGFLMFAGLGTSILLAALGPSASEGLSLAAGLAYWLIHVFLALAILAVVQVSLQRSTRFDRLSPWLIVALAGLMGALLFTPIAFTLDWVFPTAKDEDDLVSLPIVIDLVSEFGDLVLPFLLIWTGLNATRLLRIETRAPEPADKQAVEEEDEFWSRVPAKLGRDLIALTSELHYLRVYTREGEALILHAFGRALERLADIDGMRIHRSHWVAIDHVQTVRRDGERVVCRLDNGVELPVSRPYRTALRSKMKEACMGTT